jgi:hypothetical protein
MVDSKSGFVWQRRFRPIASWKHKDTAYHRRQLVFLLAAVGIDIMAHARLLMSPGDPVALYPT